MFRYREIDICPSILNLAQILTYLFRIIIIRNNFLKVTRNFHFWMKRKIWISKYPFWNPYPLFLH